jgi:hypothetical protein
LLAVAGCEDEHFVDRTPPAAVTDLRIAFVKDTTITLVWTAPGDDGWEGEAETYDLRYTQGEPPAEWIEAAPADPPSPPGPAGSAEEHTVTDLPRGQVCFVALRTLDEWGNASEFSNPVQVQTGDPAPPGGITDLVAGEFLPHGLTLTFTAPGDDSTAGRATRYEVRRSPEPITDGTWEEGEVIPNGHAPQPAGAVESLRLVNLEPGSTRHYAVRAWDDAGKAGVVSNGAEATLPVDTVPPGAVQDLRVMVWSPHEALLLWTAAGNDGDESRVAGYEIRYSQDYPTEETWSTGTLLPDSVVVMEPGQLERYVARGLPRNTLLWFGLRARDAAGNLGGMSNVMKGRILPYGDVLEVRPDGSGDAVTVQEAIDRAASGDEIVVWPGRYVENLDLRRKTLHLRSRSGPEATILDGSGGDGPVVTADSSETTVTLEGFTITGGSGKLYKGGDRHGGGIYSVPEVTMIIRGNIIRENRTDGQWSSSGAAIFFNEPHSQFIIEGNTLEDNYSSGNGGCINIGGPAVIQDNIIRRNRTGSGDGAGIRYNTNTRVVIRRNLFLENVAGDHGGGIYIGNTHVPASYIEVYENLFMGNIAWGSDGAVDCSGGAIWLYDRGAHVHHNTIAFNKADQIRNVFAAVGGICELNPGSEVLVENNILYRNQAGGIGVYGLSSSTPVTWVATFRRNLLFGDEEIHQGTFDLGVIQLILEENVFADPIFCIVSLESRGELAGISPALNQPFGVIGAVDKAGCPPYLGSLDLTGWRTMTESYRD